MTQKTTYDAQLSASEGSGIVCGFFLAADPAMYRKGRVDAGADGPAGTGG
ncbi:hypothetical protein [Falsiroseomonas sp. E2-1-a20]